MDKITEQEGLSHVCFRLILTKMIVIETFMIMCMLTETLPKFIKNLVHFEQYSEDVLESKVLENRLDRVLCVLPKKEWQNDQ